MATAGTMTILLRRHSRGDHRAMNTVVSTAWPELYRLARYYLRRERAGHTLDAQALVTETYLRLAAQSDVDWQNRRHFYGVAAQTMQRVLCDYARQRNAMKRGGGVERRPITFADLDQGLAHPETVQADQRLWIELILEKLARVDHLSAELVRLRYTSGFSLPEMARILGVSTRTLSRKWRFARAWLKRELKE